MIIYLERSHRTGFAADNSRSSASGGRNSNLRVLRLLIKRVIDLVLAITAVLLWQGGPVLFSHRRVGKNGVEFDCLKFRTMHVDAEQRMDALLRQDEAARSEWATFRKLRQDPRVTRIGAFLRKSSLDELPQLLNILRGDMSLVGPRPVVWPEVETLYKRYRGAAQYLSVRPGLTGLWQVCRCVETEYAQRIALDAKYVEKLSLRSDLMILLRTPIVVFQGKASC